MNIVKTILEYFLHPSTYKGIFGILTAAGVMLAPELQEAIIAAGLGLIGLVQVFVDDHNVEKKIAKE
jgi:hypothetical protein